jgi:hypothetical protein
MFSKITAEQRFFHCRYQKCPLKSAASKTQLSRQLSKTQNTLAARHLKPLQFSHTCGLAATRQARICGSRVF